MERLLEGSSDPEKPPRPCRNCGKERQGQPEESSDPLTLNPGTGPAAEGAGAAPSSPHPGGPDIQGTPACLPVGVPPLLSAHRPGAHVEGQGPRGGGGGCCCLGGGLGSARNRTGWKRSWRPGIRDLAAN